MDHLPPNIFIRLNSVMILSGIEFTIVSDANKSACIIAPIFALAFAVDLFSLARQPYWLFYWDCFKTLLLGRLFVESNVT